MNKLNSLLWSTAPATRTIEAPGRVGFLWSRERSPSLPPSRSVAMLPCLHALQDAQTGLVSLVSIVEEVRTAQLPLAVPALYLFVRITDAQGDYMFTLEIVRRDDDASLGEFALPLVTVQDPTGYAQIVANISGTVFERPGAYDFRLWVNERRFVGTTSIRVVQL